MKARLILIGEAKGRKYDAEITMVVKYRRSISCRRFVGGSSNPEEPGETNK